MASAAGDKSPGAFKTISELAEELGVAQHILRYWETKFPQLRPLQRAGKRRYYRPADVELARNIHRLLNEQGYTMRGAQQALRSRSEDSATEASAPTPHAVTAQSARLEIGRLAMIRDSLIAALDD
jgi:DNA-binding transcriptional MerR regulator